MVTKIIIGIIFFCFMSLPISDHFPFMKSELLLNFIKYIMIPVITLLLLCVYGCFAYMTRYKKWRKRVQLQSMIAAFVCAVILSFSLGKVFVSLVAITSSYLPGNITVVSYKVIDCSQYKLSKECTLKNANGVFEVSIPHTSYMYNSMKGIVYVKQKETMFGKYLEI